MAVWLVPAAGLGHSVSSVCKQLVSAQAAPARSYHYSIPIVGSREGGDFMVQAINKAGTEVIFIGDTVGHGEEVAAAAKGFRDSVVGQNLLSNNRFQQAHEVLEKIDQEVASDGTLSFAGLVLMVDRVSGLVSFASAGAPAGVILRNDGTAEPLKTLKNGLNLGEWRGFSYSTAGTHGGSVEVALRRGEKVVVFSDGLLEIFDNDVGALQAALLSHSHELSSWLTRIVKANERVDDVSFSVVEM